MKFSIGTLRHPQIGTLLSVQVGPVRQLRMTAAEDGMALDGGDATWESGIYKAGVPDVVQVTRGGIEGDAQADLENHGGPDNVVLAYSAGHYDDWRRTLNRPELGYGSFGENFTVSGASDETVCIGDIWRVGPSLELQVTQARQPCFKLARRLGRPDVVKRVRETSRGGWYLRVLLEGPAMAGMEIVLVERLHPDWPVARAVQTMYTRRQQPRAAMELAALPELSARWKHELVADLTQQQSQQQQ